MFDFVTQHHLFFIEERAYCLARDQITVAKGTMLILLFLYQKEYQNYLSKVSCCKNIILCNFTVKSKLKLCRTMLLLYIIKCRLLTRKLHKMEQSLMQQNGIWWVEYNSSMWSIAYCSCRAMIGHVLIRFWMLFSWYVFGMCIVSKGVEKTPVNLKMMQKVKWKPFISQEVLTFQWGSCKGHKPLTLSNEPKIFD